MSYASKVKYPPSLRVKHTLAVSALVSLKPFLLMVKPSTLLVSTTKQPLASAPGANWQDKQR